MGTQTHPKPKMWMLDCKDYVKEFKDESTFERRRLRHLMPRPTISGMAGPPRPLMASSFCSSISKTTAFSWNHHLSQEESITEPLASSRWNPTPEQLKALQEMYQRGVRTPSAEEIQLIAAKLRHFGRIEGKNVFYWFQNHKARERQKRRRQLDSFSEKKTQVIETLEAKETSSGWKYLDAEQNKKLVTTSSCTSAPKGSATMHKTAVTESRANGWTHLDEKQQRQTSHRRVAKGEAFLMDLSCMTPPCYSQLNPINATSTSEETSGTAEQRQSASLGFKIFSANQDKQDEDLIELKTRSREHEVLQLFPLRKDDPSPFITTKIGEEEITTTLNANFTPNHFYEFL